MKKEFKTKLAFFDWRPVATTDMLLTTTDVSLATTGDLLTTTDDHWRPLTIICRQLSNVQVAKYGRDSHAAEQEVNYV
jgi:hypothetical protein